MATRRHFLNTAACGFAGLATHDLLHRSACAAAASQPSPDGTAGDTVAETISLPRAEGTPIPMFPARAKRVIFLFMQGGPSHVDTFDYKEALDQRDGKTIDFVGVRFGTFGEKSQRKLMRPLWKFRRYGETGRWVSDLFPHMARHVDDLCLLHGMHTEGVAHGPSTLFLHTGATNLVRPSMGSWISYGLGNENQNLPAFVSLGPAASKGGPRNYNHAFLPAKHQATVIGRASQPATESTIKYLRHAHYSPDQLRQYYDDVNALNQAQRTPNYWNDELDTVIESYELAYRMQRVAPEVLDLNRETAQTRGAYGLDRPETTDFGHRCLLARRLAEAGVRFIQVNYSDESANPRWDQHSNMPKHKEHAVATDQPVAALLADLKERGMLDDTLVWWGGEFGRTPFSQNNNGRDHNPRGFTMFLVGGGTRTGLAYGATDEIGHEAVEGRIHMHDLHATILHLLGVDHTRLTYRYTGRDFRLTDIHGNVVSEIIA